MSNPVVSNLVEQLGERLRALTPPGQRMVVLIDGGSGAGKTSLAQALVGVLRRDDPTVQLVSLDDCYPGWSGLAAGAAMIPGMIRPEPGHPSVGHPTWDWVEGRTNGFVTVDPAASIIIEGCGALTPTNRQLATAAVWVAVDAATRRHRALARDGDGFRPWWDIWAAQEHQHWREHQPWQLADVVVDLSPGVAELRTSI